MNYSLIPLIGIQMFLYTTARYKSYRSFLIYLNGLLYHSTNNKILKNIDVASNTIITIYTAYVYKSSRLYAMLGVFIYLYNSYLYENNILDKKKADTIHVLGVQGILCIGLIKSLIEKSLIKNR